LTLSGTNTFTGLTKISNGTVALGSANALGGGGNITFNGGTLQSSSSNTVDYSSKIVNSTGPISLDTNGQNVAYAGGLGSSNTGGLTKLGSGKLTLSGTNSYTGITAVKAGVLSVSATSAIPVTGTGQIFVDSAGALNSGGAYADVQAWLNSGNITTNSTGAIALTGSSSENIDFTGYSGLSLGASGNATYTGTISPAGGVYRLGGGGAILTLSSTNALTGTNGLVVSNGTVAITAANDFSGASAVTFAAPTNPTLNLSALGGLTNSSLTLNPGATLSITSNTAAGSVTRAAALTLKRGTVTVGGNATVNSTDAITGALTIDSGGNSTVTITPNAGKNTLVNIGSYVHNAGGTALIRGTNLGVNAIASATAGASNIFITTPNLVGDTGTNTTDGGILVGVVGDTAFNGTGFGATGGLLTADSTKGVRLLAAGEYKTSITDAQTQLDNVRLSSAGGTTLTTTVNSATTINSLSILTSAASSAVQVSGTGTLKLSSGVIYSGSTTSTVANTISNTLDFNGKEAVILAGGTADLNLSGVLSNTGGNGLTVYGNKSITLSGTSANTYTGTTTVNGGTLNLSKSTGVDAIIGDLVVNSGGTAVATTSNVIADGSNVTLNGGSLTTSTETIASIALTGGGFNSYNSSPGSVLTISGNASASGLNNFSTASTLSSNTGGQLVVGGTLSLSDGGRLVVASSWNPSGAYDGSATLGGLNITNTSSGAYTAVIINSSNSAAQSGGQLILNGDVTFTGNTTNTNTVLIDAIKGSGRQGVIALTATNGNRTFNIGNGAAATDLEITAALLDGVGGASNLVKAGAGTLALSGANTYSGNTAVNAGALTLADTGSLTFYIGANGTNNAVTGSGTATFNGSFNFDLTNAAAVNGNSWNIVNVATLSESFTGTFVVNGFVENANVWTFGNYSFSEATGILTYGAIPEPSTYALLGGAAALFLAAFRRRAGKRDSASS
jgi:autotransporter-associated beta strand protein